MQIQDANPSHTLSQQDFMRYFNWPPPVPQPKKHYFKFYRNLIIIYLCLFGISLLCQTLKLFTNTNTLVVFVTYIFVAIAISPLVMFLYRVIKKHLDAQKTPPMLTDQEYENWVRSWQHSIRHYGMQRLGLSAQDVVSSPLYVRSLVWPNSSETRYYYSYNTPLLIKYGADGRPHASVNRYTFFYPTQHAIAVFVADVNALGPARFEGTRTYFYDDIVGVETSAITLNDGITIYAMQHFELRVSSGQSIGATTRVQDLDVDQTVRALRTLLRDKKYGIRGGGYNAASF